MTDALLLVQVQEAYVSDGLWVPIDSADRLSMSGFDETIVSSRVTLIPGSYIQRHVNSYVDHVVSETH